MCSNVNEPGYGDRDEIPSSCPKKQKKDKVPRRGPGVAELEKILREQDNKCTPFVSSDSSPFFFPSTVPSPAIISDPCNFSPTVQLPPPTLPQPPPAPSQPLVSSLYSSSSTNNSNSFNLRVSARPTNEIQDSRNFYGYPTVLNYSLSPAFQRKHQMMSLHPHSAMQPYPSSQLPGLYQFIEPPSNQRSCHDYTSKSPDDDQMGRVKRLRQFFTESPPMHHRDMLHNNSLDLKPKNFAWDYAASGVKLNTAGSSSSTPETQNCTRDFLNSAFAPRGFQDEQKENFEEYLHQRSHSEQSVHQKPFYRFLPLQEQNPEETTLGFNNQSEANGDCEINLSLKL